ncbi:MAG: hypothetical protein ACRD3E_09985 [Terriglobales bacterium]
MSAVPASAPAHGWSKDLRTLLGDVADEFEVAELRNEAPLGTVRQTGFARTRQPGVICLAMNRDYFAQAKDNSCARAIIAPPAVAGAEELSDKTLIVCGCAEELYLHLHAEQLPDAEEDVLDIHDSAMIDASAVVRGRVRIEAGARIGPRVVISGPAVVRQDVRIDAGAIIGCDGLYAKTIRGRRLHMPHFGGVEIGEGAYVHAGAVVMRSAIRREATLIGKGTHIGVMVNVGHDAEIGDGATVSSHGVIAGRAQIGARARVGASATVSNAIRVGEGARVRLGAVVVRDVPAGASVSGNFAIDHARTLRNYLKEAGP